MVPTAGTLPSSEKHVGKTRRVFQSGEMLLRQPRLAAGDRVAVAGAGDGRRQQHVERQFSAIRRIAANGFGGFERQHPAADGARHGQRGERPAPRDGLVLAVQFGPDLTAGGARRHDGAHAPRRLADQPKAVAADMVHVRIDRGDRRRHRDHGFERVAAFGEDGAAGFDGGVMRRADDAAAMAGAVKLHQFTAGAAKPRLRSSASALGSRPRNAL